MQRLEVSGAVRLIYRSLGVKRLNDEPRTVQSAQQLAVGLDDQRLVDRTPGRALRFEVHPACGYWELLHREV